ncbi:Crp/Fnr family transcriptional regulator [Phenylobacterium sp. 58.2.17]|uniref:Crp/Fnr family transcriptional regulator n=1 Tax=Phenylobacterium sp. 58.2.17 TaxID=2969306 RepID=UPI002264CCA3|nr:Crp/Fnr family transcriptional regulator [Phenylobacterium sp. 58.2.17]MCX7585446.1 Crp/Fnr family transcriptional regulator [Phenylobacterium sp. 58.2.17]
MSDLAANAVLTSLARSPVLAHFSQGGLERLAASGAWLALQPGEVLFQAGDPGDAVYVVVDGEVEVRNSTPDGRDVRLVALGPGALVGEMAALDGGPRSADVAATRRARLWRIARSAMLAALEAEPKAAVALVIELSARLRVADGAISDKTVLDLAGRLARLLLTEAGASGLVALTQTEIGRRLGFSREKVNRKIHEWVREGWVEVSPAGIRMLDPTRLEALIEHQLGT